MSTDTQNAEKLDLHLFNDDDDDLDLIYKKWLQELVDGITSPSKIASNIDTWIVNDANRQFKELMKRPDPRNLTPEEEKQGINMRTVAPNASGYIERVFTSIAKLCFAFPPYHAGQNRIIQFLEALKAMPPHQALDGVPPTEEEKKNGGYDNVVDLWPFGEHWMALTEVFRREADDISYPYSDVEVPGSETQIRWRNWQSAIARITSLGFVDCGFLCALRDVLPSSPFYPDLKTRKIGGPNRISGDMIAGIQWLLPQQEGRYVYQQCKKVEKSEGPRVMWTMERWRQLKDQFAWIAWDDRFSPEAREAATLAGDRMAALEGEV